jgi:hypothetical protein
MWFCQVRRPPDVSRQCGIASPRCSAACTAMDTFCLMALCPIISSRYLGRCCVSFVMFASSQQNETTSLRTLRHKTALAKFISRCFSRGILH